MNSIYLQKCLHIQRDYNNVLEREGKEETDKILFVLLAERYYLSVRTIKKIIKRELRGEQEKLAMKNSNPNQTKLF